MDLAFKRYANPFLLFDNLISGNMFFEYIMKMVENINEEKIYDVWLHKVYDMTYEDYCNQIKHSNEKIDVQMMF